MTSEYIIPISNKTLQGETAEIEKCNKFTKKMGLVLTPNEALKLAEANALALKSNGRIQFGDSTVREIIKEFYTSPYITKDNYLETINYLVEIFYFYKNETLDLIGDEDLIKYMKNSFDGVCQGSLDFLAGNELNILAISLRSGIEMGTKNVWN